MASSLVLANAPPAAQHPRAAKSRVLLVEEALSVRDAMLQAWAEELIALLQELVSI